MAPRHLGIECDTSVTGTTNYNCAGGVSKV